MDELSKEIFQKPVKIPEKRTNFDKFCEKVLYYMMNDLKYIKIYPKMFDVSLNVFALCGLERIEFEEGIKTIPEGMFGACNNLKAVKLPSSVEKIEPYAFGYCRNLKSIELNDGVVEIKAYAFQGSALTEITIPKTVKKVFSSSFLKCDRLRKII